ncbi:hypothetical protein [Streptomyces cucumeris]|uniref:hypothetical protein n=1 Tax=Streptomyces cucumeris TaxID=2962890 RepID=UPI0020C8A6C9|nr:hypothetical protein [Streptomyces sp. NEAU-Y11]MCP9209710.1 hypothetical protein [Streptomyces sp. NEAU-Y11]
MNTEDPGYFLNCIDPGGDTGMSLLHIAPDGFQLLEFATVQYRRDRDETPVTILEKWRKSYPGVHHLLYEDFHIRNTRSAAATDATALEVIGELTKMIRDSGGSYAEVFKQVPVAGKHMVSDEVLETLGLHLDNKHAMRHVRDANRHAVTHLAKQRAYRPICEMAFPRRSVRIR